MTPSEVTVYRRILQLLTATRVSFREIEHAATRTSEESARVRGVPLGCGAKALLLRCDDAFSLFVLPADRKLQSKFIRAELRVRDVRFATPEELLRLTGLVPGAVPPFGDPVLPFPLFADSSMGAAFEDVAFNAGELTRSIVMSARAWEAVAKPRRMTLSVGATE